MTISNRRTNRLAVVALATILAAAVMSAQQIPANTDATIDKSIVDAVLKDLTAKDFGSRSRGFNSLVVLLRDSWDERKPGSDHAVMSALLERMNPEDAERLKLGLITALERQGEEAKTFRPEPGNEAFVGIWVELTREVRALNDERAIPALLTAFTGGSRLALTDFCPAAVDALIRRAHEPDIVMNGFPARDPGLAVATLGDCLQRPAMMLANPDVASKIRRELIANLENSDWEIRGAAMGGLLPLYRDEEVREKLQAIAANDPYFTEMPNSPGVPRFLLREFARRILEPAPEVLYYVTRTSGEQLCRVQHATETPAGERFIGPETASFVKRGMCDHYDPSGSDPSLCWKIQPSDACSQ
jgi:hypothetical protein